MARRQIDHTAWSAARIKVRGRRGPRPWGYRDVQVAQALGQAIVDQRNKRGWSQYVLADKLRVSQPLVVYFEKGREQLSLAILLDLEEIFGLPRGFLLTTAIKAAEAAEADYFPAGALSEDLYEAASANGEE